MLLNLNKKSWIDGLRLQDYNDHCKTNEATVKTMLDLANGYNKALEEEEKMTPEQLAIKNVGKQVSTLKLLRCEREKISNSIFDLSIT